MQVVVLMGGQIGRKIGGFRGQREQLAGEFFGLRLGQLGCALRGGNPAAPARLLFVVVAVEVVMIGFHHATISIPFPVAQWQIRSMPLEPVDRIGREVVMVEMRVCETPELAGLDLSIA